MPVVVLGLTSNHRQLALLVSRIESRVDISLVVLPVAPILVPEYPVRVDVPHPVFLAEEIFLKHKEKREARTIQGSTYAWPTKKAKDKHEFTRARQRMMQVTRRKPFHRKAI